MRRHTARPIVHAHCLSGPQFTEFITLSPKNVHVITADPIDSKSVVSIPDFVHRLRPFPVSELSDIYLSRQDARQERARRIVNIVVALIGLLITAPLMLVVALLIRLTSRGPVFYKQQRVGLDRRAFGEPAGNSRRSVDHGGRLFTIYKFRTMRVGQASQVWASPDDPRTTPLGRILRKYRIDELPQLVNVLKGDMNVVGPRPEQPAIFQELRTKIDHYPIRQQVLPGITGLAQITLSYDSSVDDVRKKLKMDMRYLRRRSAVEDIRIMALTLPVLVFRRGAW